MARGAAAQTVEAQAFEAINAAVAVLTAELDRTGPGASSDTDQLHALADSCLDILGGIARSEARLAALKAQAAAKFAATARSIAAPAASPQEATAHEMAVTAEIACVLTIGSRAADALLSHARQLTATLPLTLSALQAGTISWQHARAMVEETACLDPAGAASLEAHFLDPNAPDLGRGCPAGEMPASRFRNKARTWRERHHHESIGKRHAKSVLDRRIEYTPDQDGMAWLSAYLPAATANGIWNRVTAISRGLQRPAESRTLTQLRADVLAISLLNAGLFTAGPNRVSCAVCGTEGGGIGVGTEGRRSGAGAISSRATGGVKGAGISGDANTSTGLADVPSPRAQVLVTVPVFSLIGATDEPAMLDGYGPIPASMARDLVANGAGSFYRVLVDPRDGAPLEIGRKSYRIPKPMRQWLRLRDGKCPFPGCNNNSLDNEADHLLAWHKGGTTGISNLGQPCPKHHRLKHTSGWTPTTAGKGAPPGWISPMGRTYKSEHQDWEPPHWPTEQKQDRHQEVRSRPASNLPPPVHVPSGGHPDFVHLGLSLGEDGLGQFLHAPA
ncbi:hypothetical protein QFZ40_004124 [Arthrobacter pascens]|uniref:HNH endonuclease signature motif containing protein n=1 Tax=Arthrobacter pascens TaxID=1677 RepID=UPI0027854841|nr:HNH endonuclease signature motif containing protein [Arthrobacter pascens]MDQ0636215.1 hypothetical protein [Arthrobacter pascens]